jgi:hypothetical protein
VSWAPNDLVTDADLVAYESQILTQFDRSDWKVRRAKAIEDWLFPLLEASGFAPQRFRTRFIPEAVLGSTSSVFTDRTSASQTQDGIDLAATLAASSDALYLGSVAPFRGVSVRMHDGVNTVAGTATWDAWADTWQALGGITDATKVDSKCFGRGGAVTWTLPETLVRRSVNAVGPFYWARVRLSAAPTGATIGPVLVIRRSRLCAAVTLRTLALIFKEAPTSLDGPWADKAVWYEAEADKAWLRAADKIGGEFDTDNDDAISATEADQTAAEVNSGGWRWERG